MFKSNNHTHRLLSELPKTMFYGLLGVQILHFKKVFESQKVQEIQGFRMAEFVVQADESQYQ